METKFCEHCGARMSINAAFCPTCGTPVNAVSKDQGTDYTIHQQAVYKRPSSTGFWKSFGMFYRSTFKVNGNMSRKTYWLATLGNILIGIIFSVAYKLIESWGNIRVSNANLQTVRVLYRTVYYSFMTIYVVWAVWLLVAGITAIIQRLHDTGKSGWYWWLGIIPIVGQIALIILLCQPHVEENSKKLEGN